MKDVIIGWVSIIALLGILTLPYVNIIIGFLMFLSIVIYVPRAIGEFVKYTYKCMIKKNKPNKAWED